MLLGEVHTQGLAIALGLVVTGARPGARDIAAIGFGSRNGLGRRVAVDLARRVEQNPAHRVAGIRLFTRALEHVAQTIDIGIHGLDGELAIVGGRGDGGRMHQIVDVAKVGRQRVDDIMPANLQGRVAFELCQPLRHAPNEVVINDQLGLVGRIGLAIVEMQHRLHQVIAEETSPPDDQQALAAQLGELLLESVTDVIEVLFDHLTGGHLHLRDSHVESILTERGMNKDPSDRLPRHLWSH